MKKIVLISGGQPSTNPRLVKEANALVEAGYEVFVIYTFWTKWADATDKLLFTNVRWTPLLVGGSPFKNKYYYIFTRIRFKVFSIIAKRLTLKYGVSEIASGRTFHELLKKATSIKADLYIAHTLSALPVAVKVALLHDSKCGFDAEDFHRFETDNSITSFPFKISEYLENKYLPQLDYLSASSPQIASAYNQLFPNKKINILLNVFSCLPELFVPFYNRGNPLKLFWFSQTIGPNRGLEEIANALKLVNNYPFELHLLGNLSAQYKSVFLHGLKECNHIAVYFHNPMPAEEIIPFASQFDIGLAIENGEPENRNICLTNKIFSYVQAGLAVVVSDTKAQLQFITTYPEIGNWYPKNNAEALANILLDYHLRRKHLFETKNKTLSIGRQRLNWGIEKASFLATVEHTLNSN